MEMTKRVRTAAGAAVIAFVLAAVGLLAVPAGAFAYSAPAAVDLKVSVVTEGTLPSEPETFEIVLEALDGAPLPKGAVVDEAGTCSIEVMGGASGAFEDLTYERPGVWSYKVSQKPCANAYGVYDDTVYEVTVYVTNDANGELETTVAAYPNGTGDKSDLVFTNFYESPPMARTGDELFGLVAALAGIAVAAGVVCFVVLRRSKAQRAGHRR